MEHGRAAPAAPTRVVVVSHENASTITDCLDGLAVQGLERVEVVVVDLDSSDSSSDAAIRHPVPFRVVVVPPGDLDRVLEAGGADPAGSRLVLLPADQRPAAGWLEAARRALDDADLVFGPDRRMHHLAVDLSRLAQLSFAGASTFDLEFRARAAGATVAVDPDMLTQPAGRTAPSGQLPATTPPAADGARHRGLISVVVCTKGRPAHLARCLDSLGSLCDEDHEIVVVDNEPTPTIDDGCLPPRARLLHESVQGLDRARNRGWRAATGDLIAFVDDDCAVDPHWLTHVRAAFADPAVGGVTGRVRPASLAEPSQRWFEAHFSFDRGPRARRFTLWDRRPWYPLWTGVVGTGCNMAFRRAHLAELDGFDELLDMGTRIGGGGDLDLFARLVDAGVVLSYEPEALVWHHHRDTAYSSHRQFFGYGTAVGALVAKSVLDRPGQRIKALRFFLDRFRVAARLARASRRGAHLLPVRLLVVDLIGQCVGPFMYLAGRAGQRSR